METSSCSRRRTRFLVGVAFVTLATVLVTRGTDQMIDASSFVDRSYQILGDLDSVELLLKEDESAQLGYLATGNQDFLKPVDAIRDRMGVVFADLERLLEMEKKLAEDDKEELPKKKLSMQENLQKLVYHRQTLIQSISDIGKGATVAELRASAGAKIEELLKDLPDKMAGLEAARKIVADGAGKEYAAQIQSSIKELRALQEEPLKARLAKVYRSAEDLAEFVVGIHFVYVGFVVLGLLLILIGWACCWQWVRNLWFRSIHLTMILIVVVEAILQIRCPLTDWEHDLKVAAGKSSQDGGFIARWMHQVVFRDSTNWKEHQWIFEIAYICVGLLILVCFFIIPPCWRKKPIAPAPPANVPEPADSSRSKT